MATLHIRQQARGDDRHQVTLTLKRPSRPDQTGEANIEFALTPQEQEDLRSYLEDYLEHAGRQR